MLTREQSDELERLIILNLRNAEQFDCCGTFDEIEKASEIAERDVEKLWDYLESLTEK